MSGRRADRGGYGADWIGGGIMVIKKAAIQRLKNKRPFWDMVSRSEFGEKSIVVRINYAEMLHDSGKSLRHVSN